MAFDGHLDWEGIDVNRWWCRLDGDGDGSKFVWGVEDCEVKGIIVENTMGVKKLISRERKIVWVI